MQGLRFLPKPSTTCALIFPLVGALFLPISVAHAEDEAASFTAEQVGAGAKLYTSYCAVCHGPKMVEQGGGFFDLRAFPKAQNKRFMLSVSNGKNSMPPWKSVLSQEQIGQLWAYVATGDKP